jgi:predicted DCC family thiol-disulfide oxidoreductase YuxK
MEDGVMRKQSFARAMVAVAALAVGLGATAGPVRAQWSAQYEQFYMPAEHNWVFRRSYPAADRLFNAFDYGHAILYEKLWSRPGAPPSELEQREYDFVTRRLLVSPPRLPLEEGAIEVSYVKLVPEAKLMFEWAHILHRQMYDVLADERLSWEEKDAEVAYLLRYYRSRPSLAFSSVPKNMELMEGQYYSTAFREKYPKFNGLIWGYHWLQVGLYEPLMTARTPEERQTGITGAVTRFRQMLENAPENMPRVMPMTAAISPVFAARYPEAAIIFDNLHGMHDVISDILASPQVPRERKREEILRAAARYRDATSFVMTEAEWREMALAMGVQNMGGPVTGFLAGFPRPTVERGAVMAHGPGGHGAMQHGQTAQAGADAHAGHGNAAPPPPEHVGTDHGQAANKGLQPASALRDARIRELHERMMADPVIRARVATEPELRRRMEELHGGAGADHAAHAGAAATAADSARALEFVVRVLADPQVEARIHADPRLHQLWSDPEVQRRLTEVRGGQPAASQPHRH